jgi:hypothetical protein
MFERQPGVMIAGAGLLLAGGWLAAEALGAGVIGVRYVWPGALVLLGVALFGQRAARQARRPGSGAGLAFVGALAGLLGAFLCVFSFQVGRLTWSSLRGAWPGFLLIIAAALLVVFLEGDMQERGQLVLAHVVGGLGLLALPFTLGIVRLRGLAGGRVWPLAAAVAVTLGAGLGLWIISRARGGAEMDQH